MKTLNKPQVVLTLMILVAYLLFSFLSDHIFPFASTYVSDEYLRFIHAYKTHFFVAAVAILIFFAIKLYRKKALTLQEQYHSFFEGNPMPMGIVDAESHKFLAANKATIEIYGYSQEEFLTLSVGDIRVNDELEEASQDLKAVNQVLIKGGPKKHRKKNGEIILVEVSSSEVVFKNKRCRLLLAHNITEIVKAREEKRIAEEEKNKQESFTSYVL